jgi:hypothetical protein
MLSLNLDTLRYLTLCIDCRSMVALPCVCSTLYCMMEDSLIWSGKLQQRFGYGGGKQLYLKSLKAGSPRVRLCEENYSPMWMEYELAARRDVVKVAFSTPIMAVITLEGKCLLEAQGQPIRDMGYADDALVIVDRDVYLIMLVARTGQTTHHVSRR